MTLQLIVITPQQIVWNTDADEIILPGLDGQIGLLKNHAPLISALDIGVLRVKIANKKRALILLGGFVEVEENKVTVIVNGIELIKLTDLAAAKVELSIATDQLEQAKTDKEKIEASQNLKKVMARVQAISFLF